MIDSVIGYHAPTTIQNATLSVIYSHLSRWQNVTITWVPLSFPQLEILPHLRAFQIQAFTNPEQNAISYSVETRISRD